MKTRFILGALFSFAIVAACSSSSVSGNDALNQVAGAFCSRAASCCTSVAASTCQQNVVTAYKSVGFNTGSDYTSDSVNQCVTAIKALGCPTSGLCVFTVPSGCPAGGAILPIAATSAGDGGTENDAGGSSGEDGGAPDASSDDAAAAD
jgi:hypothetical protein